MSFDTTAFYNEHGTILPNKLAEFLMNEFNLIHIKSNKTMTNSQGLSTPIYAYNPQYGVYECLTAKETLPLSRLIFNVIPDINNAKRNETITYIKAQARVEPFITHNIIAFNNTLIDIDTMQTVEKSPSIVTTTSLSHVTYDPTKVDHALLDTFMNNLFSKDKDMHKLAYEIIGYCMANSNFMQKFFMLIGDGGNGKSGFMDLVKELYGESNLSYVALEDIDGNRFRIAEIFGKLVNIGDDIEKNAILNTAILKKITTGEPVQLEYKGQTPFTYANRAKLIFSANEMPNLYDTSTGMNDRIMILPFNNRIRGTSSADKDIIAKIVNTGGITVLLNRAIEGLTRLRNTGVFTIPKAVEKATDDYIQENNQIAVFLQAIEDGEIKKTYVSELDYGTFSPTRDAFDTPLDIGEIPLSVTYQYYNHWAKANGYKPYSNKNFIKNMEQLGYERKLISFKNHKMRVWVKPE